MSTALPAIINNHQHPDFPTTQFLDFWLVLPTHVNPNMLASDLGYTTLKVDYTIHGVQFRHSYIKLSYEKGLKFRQDKG
jgi:hypothetical protein